jgi:hypothetical protein
MARGLSTVGARLQRDRVHARPTLVPARIGPRTAILATLLSVAIVLLAVAGGTRVGRDSNEAGAAPAPAQAGGAIATSAGRPAPPAFSTGSVDTTGVAPPAAVAPVVLTQISALASDGIPAVALLAYRNAATAVNRASVTCHLPWSLLAGIGRVESDHGRFAGAQLRTDGTSTTKIIGIALNGVGTSLIRDTDHGRLDGDDIFDRAVGPMQFIPSTWATYGADGDGDGVKNPFDIQDATLAAAHYLCAAGGDLASTAGRVRAILAYNHSGRYVSQVLALSAMYGSGRDGIVPVTAPPIPKTLPTIAPVDPGPPRSREPQHRTTAPAYRPTHSSPSRGTATSKPASKPTSTADPIGCATAATSTSSPGSGTPTADSSTADPSTVAVSATASTTSSSTDGAMSGVPSSGADRTPCVAASGTSPLSSASPRAMATPLLLLVILAGVSAWRRFVRRSGRHSRAVA